MAAHEENKKFPLKSILFLILLFIVVNFVVFKYTVNMDNGVLNATRWEELSPSAAHDLVSLVQFVEDDRDVMLHYTYLDQSIDNALEDIGLQPQEVLENLQNGCDVPLLIVQNKYSYVPTHTNDCEDISLWLAVSIDSKYNPQLMSINYLSGGHFVCMYKKDGKYGHVGNYGHMFGFDSPYKVAQDIARWNDKKIVYYELYSPNDFVK